MSSAELPQEFNWRTDMRRHWGVYVGLLVAFAIWCAVDVMPRARLDPAHPELHMTDVTVYTEASKAIFGGEDPYKIQSVRGWPYIYPPLFAILIAPLAWLPEHWQGCCWFAISVVCLWGCYVESQLLLQQFRIASSTVTREPFYLLLAFATAALPALNCLQRGQVGLALLYPLMLGLRWTLKEHTPIRWFLAGILLALPIAIKITPALPVACLGLVLTIQAIARKHLRPRFIRFSIGLALGILLFFFVVPASIVGWDRNIEFLKTFNTNVSSKVNDVRSDDFGGNVTSKRNQSLSNAAYRFGNWALARVGLGPDDQLADTPGNQLPMDSYTPEFLLLVVRIVAGLAIAVCAVLVSVRRDRLCVVAMYGLALVATFVISPVARGHYFLLWLPGVLFIPVWLDRQRVRNKTRWLAIAPVVLCGLHYCLLDYTGRIGLLGIGTTIWYFIAVKQLIKTTLKAGFFETGDSPQVRATFVGGTIGDRTVRSRSGNVANDLVPQFGEHPAIKSSRRSLPRSVSPLMPRVDEIPDLTRDENAASTDRRSEADGSRTTASE